jgi:hypothetical protein
VIFSNAPHCRGENRAEHRRKLFNHDWAAAKANKESAPFRMRIVEAIEKMRREWLALQKTKKVEAKQPA